MRLSFWQLLYFRLQGLIHNLSQPGLFFFLQHYAVIQTEVVKLHFRYTFLSIFYYFATQNFIYITFYVVDVIVFPLLYIVVVCLNFIVRLSSQLIL